MHIVIPDCLNHKQLLQENLLKDLNSGVQGL